MDISFNAHYSFIENFTIYQYQRRAKYEILYALNVRNISQRSSYYGTLKPVSVNMKI